jgi:hypothetical protein
VQQKDAKPAASMDAAGSEGSLSQQHASRASSMHCVQQKRALALSHLCTCIACSKREHLPKCSHSAHTSPLAHLCFHSLNYHHIYTHTCVCVCVCVCVCTYIYCRIARVVWGGGE